MPRASSLVFVLLAACGASAPRPTTGAPAWREASVASFEEAAHEDRIVVLSIQADWCHWCHVMNATTYADADVLALLRDHFVVVRAEADARPDLAERYTNYGWPATIFFAPDGREILRLRGHRNPQAFRAILTALVDDQRAGRELGSTLEGHVTDAPREAALGDLDEARVRVRMQVDALYDDAQDGWGTEQKYPFGALVQHALLRASDLDEGPWHDRGMRSLSRYAELIDPVWGGMYQYSDGDWSHPHFEKIASIQAGAIQAFADAYAVTQDDVWLDHADHVVSYLTQWLRTADATFQASQDADLRVEGRDPMPGATYYAQGDEARRALGIPRIDPHVYASVNGELAAALARLSEVRDDADADELALATEAIDAITRTHRDERGLFRHDAASEDATRYLADQAQVLRALVAIHQAGGDSSTLASAIALADATLAAFRSESGALRASDASDASPLAASTFPIEENALVARSLLALARLEDREDRRETALAILEAISVPSAVAELGRKVGEYAIALELAQLGMVSFTVVGPPHDPRTLDLARAVRAYPEPRRVLVMQPGEGHYPLMDEPVLFVCGEETCSEPIRHEDDTHAAIDRFFGR